MDKKESNPKDIMSIKKAPLSTVSPAVLMEVGVAMFEGARKYGKFNWRKAGVVGSVYYDATIRHLMDWFDGQDIDTASGLSHITKAIASLTVLRDSMIFGNWVDDRPPSAPEGWMEALHKKTIEIIEKYPDAVAPVTKKEI